MSLRGKNRATQKHNPIVNRPKPASSGSAPTPEVAALTFKEAGAAGSFLWLLSFAEKESDALAASDTNRQAIMHIDL
jgi:hypothetical protein